MRDHAADGWRCTRPKQHVFEACFWETDWRYGYDAGNRFWRGDSLAQGDGAAEGVPHQDRTIDTKSGPSRFKHRCLRIR